MSLANNLIYLNAKLIYILTVCIFRTCKFFFLEIFDLNEVEWKEDKKGDEDNDVKLYSVSVSFLF